jgi:hypothetical protein
MTDVTASKTFASTVVINNGDPVDPDDLSRIDYFLRQQQLLRDGGPAPFVRPPLGNMRALCDDDDTCCCIDGDEAGAAPCCFVPEPGAPCQWFTISAAIIAPLLLFECLVLSGDDSNDEVWSRVIAAVLAVALIVALLVGALMDPGVLLPARVNSGPQHEVLLCVRSGNAAAGDDSVTHITLEVCQSCAVSRAPRSSHSPRQDVCVAEFDHYCSLLGMAVGARTFRFFVAVLWLMTLFCYFVAARSIVVCVVETRKMSSDSSGASVTALSVTRLVFAYLLSIFGLLVACTVQCPAVAYVDRAGRGLTLKDELGRRRFVSAARDWECNRCCSRLFGALPASMIPRGPISHIDAVPTTVSVIPTEVDR